MINFGISNNYKSPYGSENLQEIIKTRITKQQEGDSYTSKTAKTVKKAGKAALTIGAVAAGAVLAYKNKSKLLSFIKNIPDFIAKHKPSAGSGT